MSEQEFRILIVEDEALVAMALEMELQDRGHNVIGPAARVDDALSILETEKIDGAILDVMLGRQEVFPVADRLVDLNVPFIFHSGHLDNGRIRGRYSAPSHSKPAMPETLLESLLEMVSND